MAVGRHQEALVDGKKAVELKSSWVKGYARVGAAFFALEQFTEVRGLSQVTCPCRLRQYLPPGKVCYAACRASSVHLGDSVRLGAVVLA